jgi:hypothetical protein
LAGREPQLGTTLDGKTASLLIPLAERHYQIKIGSVWQVRDYM